MSRAPEHPFPAQLEDARAVLDWLTGQQVARERMVVAGESAGGNLVVALQLALRDAGEAQVAGAIAVSLWLDLTHERMRVSARAPYDYGHQDMLDKQAREFAGERPLDDPMVSPGRAELAGLAPLFVQAGDAEVLFDDAEAFHGRLDAAGVEHVFDVCPDMPHACSLLAAYHAEGQGAIERAAAWFEGLVSA